MNELMQIESSTCNTTNVAPHISQTTANSVNENASIGPSITITSGPTIISAPNSGSTISVSAPPMVFTVNAQQTSAGAPVLKLVSPVEGGAPQLIKVVPASAFVNPTAPISQLGEAEGQVATSSATTTIYQNTGTVAVVQKMNDGPSGLSQSSDGSVVSQRVYSIVPANQQKTQSVVTSAVIQKTQFNNGQQRLHTLPAQLTNARVAATAVGNAGTQKVQILSNVVVSKQNIVLNKAPLQAQRQILTTIAQKPNSNIPKTVVTSAKLPVTVPQTQQPQQTAGVAPPKIQTVNNLSIKPVVNNSFAPKVLKTVTAMNRPALQIQQPVIQQPKTIKTLSPGSQKPPGIKTLSPSVANHFNSKIPPAGGPVGGRVGIKTLGPQKSPVNRGNMGPKPNYIGKHANQAQKMQHHKNVPSGMPGAKPHRNTAAQRVNYALLSPTKNVNSQSNYNQALTAQILHSLPSAGPTSATKTYPLQSPPDETSLSENIGPEIQPDYSHSLSYLYQIVMLDHNYGAPPPTSPPPVMPRTPVQHQSPAVGGTLNGALLAAVGREREKEREREVFQMNVSAGIYGSGASNTGKRHNRHANNAAISVPPAHPAPVLANIVPTIPSLSANLLSAVQDDDAASTISSEGGRGDEGDEGEETETAPEGEGDEDGITRCICDFVHDDGYMICCDVCSSWQHIVCMGIDKEQIPEKYSCVRCLPRRVDRQQARNIQLKRLKELPPLGVPPPAPPAPVPEIRPASGNTSDTGSDTSTAESTGEPHHPPHYGRQQPTGKLSLNNNLIRKKRNTPVPVSARRKSEPAPRRNPLQKRQQRRESARETSTTGRRTAMKKREKNKVLKRKMKSRSSVDDDSQDSWHGAANAYSNSMGASVVQLRQWIENYEEAVTNHYSPELRARITNMRANGSHATTGGVSNQPLAEKQAPSTAQADVAVQKCRVGNQSLSGFKIVLATQTLSPNAPVIELRGKYMLSTQHRTASGAGSGGGAGGGGLQTRQHSQRPGPFLFFYRLPRDGTEVCVDTRTYGNDARFIRRSCRPNAELRHLVEKGTLHLYVITTSNVDKNNELTIKHESHDLAAVAAAASSGNNLTQATAAVSAAGVPCACGGGPQTCGLYNSTRKNGGVPVSEPPHTATNSTESTTHRKRRGRRASTPNRSETPPPPPPPPPVPEKEKEVEKEASPSPVPLQIVIPPVEEPPVVEEPPPTPAPPALSTRRASSHQRAVLAAAVVPTAPVTEIRTRSTSEHSVERDREPRETREPREGRELREERKADAKDKKKKLTREERKMEAIMKAFERMEKAQQRKQEVQARQAQRRESDPIPSSTETHQEQKRPTISLRQENGEIEREIVRTRRKKRKGRSRTISTNSQQSTTRRRTRVNSTDSYITSGDDSSLLSPPLPASSVTDTIPSPRHTRSMSSQERHSAADNSGAENLPRDLQSPEPTITAVEKFQNTPGSQLSDISSPGQVVSAAGMLLSLANGGAPGGSMLPSEKSPEVDGNSSGSNSSLQSSPSTPLSSACLLVAAAVGPLEPGFKFPKTKKAIMNEWLNKPSDPMPTPSPISPSLSLHTPVLEPLSNEQTAQQSSMEYYSPGSTTNKSLATLVQAATLCDSPPQAGGRNLAGGQGAGNAKKRWLRQAISEECDSPCSRPESPPGSSEMVAPPKKRRLARESLSSEQFTPPTTPTMLVPPSNSLADEDYPNNDEEFYTNEDRNQNLSDSSPPTTDDSGKEQSRVENMYSSGEGPLGSGTGYQHRDELDAEMGHKEHVSDMQMDFGDIKSEEKKYPDALPSSLLDPRLGRDSRPIFRDSAQLLGTVEKTIRFYEENLTGPVTAPEPILSPPPVGASPIVSCVLNDVEEQVGDLLEQATTTSPVPVASKPVQIVAASEIELITATTALPLASPIVAEPIAAPVIVTPVKTEKPAPKPEIITPAKRKLSISEYRQRKQLKPGADRNSGTTTPERANSPETPPPASVSNLLNNTISTTSTSGSVTATPGLTSPTAIPAARSRARSASSSSSTSSLSSDEESIAGTAIQDVISDVKASSGVEPQLPMAFNSAPTAVERQRENVERLKKAFGLALDDETRKNATITRETSAISPKSVTSPIIPAASPGKTATSPKIVKAAPPTINPTLTTSDLLAKISEGSITTKLMLSLETSSLKRPKSPIAELSLLKKSSPERVILKNPPSPELAKSRSVERELELKSNNIQQNEDLDPYTKFQENVTTNFIPPFNNPVYPNSAQFTGFSSVIDSSPYEGRNPSPPPSELLKSSPYANNPSLTMSPSTTGYK